MINLKIKEKFYHKENTFLEQIIDEPLETPGSTGKIILSGENKKFCRGE